MVCSSVKGTSESLQVILGGTRGFLAHENLGLGFVGFSSLEFGSIFESRT